MITRPETRVDGASHTYYDADGRKLLGVSSIAKIGEALGSFSIGAAWGWRLGYEGALRILDELHMRPEDMRRYLEAENLTPWGQRDRAAARGNWAHDLLEALANTGAIPSTDLLATVDDEHRGHARGILQWYVDYRPSFVATEVQITSTAHGFAGRYDIRCMITSQALEAHGFDLAHDQRLCSLCLVDLKTSKRVYPLSHFVQLEGYELAGVEMGFPATDGRFVLNTHPDGTYDFVQGYATREDFLAYLGAYRAIKRLEDLDPEKRRARETEQAVLGALPGLARDIARTVGMGLDARAVGRILGKLRQRGLVRQDTDRCWHAA